MRPTLDSAAIEVVRQRMLGRVARRRVSPEDYAWVIADSLAFDGHPYANHPGGDERSLKGLTAAAIRQYHKENLITSRLVLVVAGDLDRAKVEGALAATLGTLPRGEYKWQLPPAVVRERRSLVVAQRAVRTNYLVGTLFGPARGSPEYAAFDQAMSLFGSFVSYNVREAAQLSYAAGVTTVGNGVPHARLFVSTTDPDSVIRIVNTVREYLTGNVTIPRARIREQADNYTRAYLSASETASGQSYALANAFLYEGDARMAARSAEVTRRLTFFDMRRSLINHTKCFQWAFVGDTASAPRELMLGKDPTCK
jgi:zinc protease